MRSAHDSITVDHAHLGTRLGVFAVALLGLLLLYARYRPYRYEALSAERFSMLQAEWRDNADLVIAGDSRAQAAIAPGVLATHRSGRILNFGQPGRRNSAPYFRAIDRVLDEHSAHPTLLLGISAFSLTHYATESSPTYSASDVWAYRNFDDVLKSLSPTSQWEVIGLLRHPGQVTRHRAYYRRDGWVSVNRYPTDPHGEIDLYRQYFQQVQVEPAIVHVLMDNIRAWRAKGVEVLGTRTPSSREMIQLEDKVSGFNEASFAKQFEAAGGRWIHIAPQPWETQDGGHVTPAAARVYSAQLARAL
jgi:hypothetical protein